MVSLPLAYPLTIASDVMFSSFISDSIFPANQFRGRILVVLQTFSWEAIVRHLYLSHINKSSSIGSDDIPLFGTPNYTQIWLC